MYFRCIDFEQLCEDILELDKKLPKGIINYVKEGRVLLNNYFSKINYDKSYKISIPDGISIYYGDDNYLKYEICGYENIDKCGFILVAGGIGERLHINNIKIGMKYNTINEKSYIELYCDYIKSFQRSCNKELSFCIMTSDCTHDLSENFFGMNESQFYIIKQSSVPCFSSFNGDLVYNKKFLLKPHGHGDVHRLLYENKILEKWILKGVENVIIFQDTNSLALNSIYPLIGMSKTHKKEVVFLSTKRFVGEKASVICCIEENNKKYFRAVDYNRLPALNGEDIRSIQNIKSEFPAVTNIICFEIHSYLKTLSKTKGILPNFILPKLDKDNKIISPVRLECVLQDYPLLLDDTSQVDHLKMERWIIFNPVKELEMNNAVYSFTNGAKLYNQKNVKCLKYVGCKVDDNVNIYISPSTAISYSDYKKHFSNRIHLKENSSIQLYGDIYIKELYLDGKLSIKAKDGFTSKFNRIVIKNRRNIEINSNRNSEIDNLEFS